MISKEKEKNIKVSKVPKEIKKEGEGSIFMEPQTPGSVFILSGYFKNIFILNTFRPTVL